MRFIIMRITKSLLWVKYYAVHWGFSEELGMVPTLETKQEHVHG